MRAGASSHRGALWSRLGAGGLPGRAGRPLCVQISVTSGCGGCLAHHIPLANGDKKRTSFQHSSCSPSMGSIVGVNSLAPGVGPVPWPEPPTGGPELKCSLPQSQWPCRMLPSSCQRRHSQDRAGAEASCPPSGHLAFELMLLSQPPCLHQRIWSLGP